MQTNIKETVRPEARKDIIELGERIEKFKSGQMDEERFKLFRLTRGVYGQRQQGVQMVRIKLPYGKVTAAQLEKIAEVSDNYATGNLHLTTRQDIQLHFVKVDDTPQLWADLEEDQVTMREACGNTVRNVTASPTAGIDPSEPFDVTPYAHALANYFLRNPICQEMGRKIKIAFSSSNADTGYTFFHCFGFIPKIENGVRGFKVVVGGGLGAQPIVAQTAFEFLPADQILPFTEAGLRVFDRHGERQKREKARIKFLVKKLGLEAFLQLVEEERQGLALQSIPIEATNQSPIPAIGNSYVKEQPSAGFDDFKLTNVIPQKQPGYYAVQLKIATGDLHSDKARALATLVRLSAGDDLRVTVNQGLLLRFVPHDALPYLYNRLKELGLADNGFGRSYDVTACPGTDTCNLGITNSTAITHVLEDMLRINFPQLLNNQDLNIKISGCMNSCGQHGAAAIGLHGSSIKVGNNVIPAMQLMMGGGLDADGQGYTADRVIKLPTKRIPEAIKISIKDYLTHARNGETFRQYFQRQNGRRYFFSLLKPLADTESLTPDDFIDWGEENPYQQAIGVGECAGVSLDVVGTVIKESLERLQLAQEAQTENRLADATYHAYTSFVIGAKALLLSIDVLCNTQVGILNDFEENLGANPLFEPFKPFAQTVLSVKNNTPEATFAKAYISRAGHFAEAVQAYRTQQTQNDQNANDKTIIRNHYDA